MSLQFCEDLISWFWTHGCKRGGDYAISTIDFTGKLYDLRKELTRVQQAETSSSRPAFAVWGPSQTGKSTLVSSYLDRNACVEEDPAKCARGGALDWGGANPTFFMKPASMEKPPGWVTILNPFNAGADASACLTRFVQGGRAPGGRFHVVNADFPVQIHFVSPKDLMNALARGYDTECSGNGPAKRKTDWDVAAFNEALGEFKTAAGAEFEPSRAAFEFLHDFAEVLDDMVFAKLARFRKLAEEEGGLANWRNVLGAVFAEKRLISSEAEVRQFVTKVLWDGCPSLTAYYDKLLAKLKDYDKRWQGKTLFCSMPVAMLLLDMEACVRFFKREAETDYDRRVREMVPRLGYRVEGDKVFIGIGDDFPTRFVSNPEDFGIFQGLVWELVVPLNLEHVDPSSFRTFMENADLLDFPGVGNEPANEHALLDVWLKEGCWKPKDPPQNSLDANAELFFQKILKRGKTASIVATYAKRMTIDGFNIFLNLQNYRPANAQQLEAGIATWWSSMVPDYNRGGPSPLPLNLALCWWAKLINEAQPGKVNLGRIKEVCEALGDIGRPEIATTFALNYYRLPAGKILEDNKFRVDSTIYNEIRSQTVFQYQFRRDVSQTSFRMMAEDQQTGGTDFFFDQLRMQVKPGGTGTKFNRQEILRARRADGEQRVSALLLGNKLFLPPKNRDIRVEHLTKLEEELIARVQGRREEEMRAINYALREFVDINFTNLNMVPSDRNAIHEKFIQDQYQKWIASQVERYRAWVKGGRKTRPDWAAVGITSEALLRDYLEAMTVSVLKEIRDEMVPWLRRMVKSRRRITDDLRPYLAVKMANALVYGGVGIPTFDDSSGEGELEGSESDHVEEPLGEACPSYQTFVAPFIEQVRKLRDRDAEKLERPENIPGAAELKEVCVKYSFPVPE